MKAPWSFRETVSRASDEVEIESFEREEYLLFSGFNDDGESIDIETCGELFRCRALSTPRSAMLPPDVEPARAGGEATRGVHDHPPRGEEEKKAFDLFATFLSPRTCEAVIRNAMTQ